MDALGIIGDLLAYMEWADARVWTAIHRLEKSDENLIERLQHLHATQHAFLMMWRGQPLDFSNVPSDIEAWTRDFYAGLAAFLPQLDAASLDRPLNMPWADKYAKNGAAPTTVGETLVHIAMHTGHHRGQLCTRIRELGGQPPLVDYIAWLWLGRPKPEWLHPAR